MQTPGISPLELALKATQHLDDVARDLCETQPDSCRQFCGLLRASLFTILKRLPTLKGSNDEFSEAQIVIRELLEQLNSLCEVRCSSS